MVARCPLDVVSSDWLAEGLPTALRASSGFDGQHLGGAKQRSASDVSTMSTCAPLLCIAARTRSLPTTRIADSPAAPLWRRLAGAGSGGRE